MKKIYIFFIIFIIFILKVNIFAVENPNIVAEGAVLIDITSNQILYEKNKDKIFYPASTTKIMTALLTLENCRLDDSVIIGKNPSRFIDGDKIYIFEGEKFTVNELLYPLLIASANDVALALAEHVADSEVAFASLMNKRAIELGCKNTNFINPHGLFDKNHYTTAYDLSLIAAEAIKNDIFRNIISTKSYFMEPTNKQPLKRPLSTNNYILLNTKYHVDGANGIKTGYTTESLHSFVGSAFRDDIKLIVVLLNDKKPGLWEDANLLLNYGFDNYKTTKLISSKDLVTNIEITNSDMQIPLIAKNDFYYTINKNHLDKIESNIVINKNINNYILKGQNMGFIEFLLDGKKIGSVDLIADMDLPATILYNYKKVEKDTVKKVYKPIIFIFPILFFLLIFLINKKNKRKNYTKKNTILK